MASTASAIPASRLHGHHDRPSMVSVGTIIFLASDLMFFAALFASYFTIRAVSHQLWQIETEKLNVPYAAVNTTPPTRIHRMPDGAVRPPMVAGLVDRQDPVLTTQQRPHGGARLAR